MSPTFYPLSFILSSALGIILGLALGMKAERPRTYPWLSVVLVLLWISAWVGNNLCLVCLGVADGLVGLSAKALLSSSFVTIAILFVLRRMRRRPPEVQAS